ncbi:ABC transporter ATP-binding protein [Streptobacillus moniliformis]|uniref:Nickel import system ATP-binding protein NikD n=1 Tax=Streptobacillus moniliformis (strain ATCC 14647 / DSM 12112 / NCTC 10651 / 9901) TaxID=519441 RepID=D1AVZ1_STRM9|nr:ABC transporter ATP-binding protein [Streptobacillus moniliformis]ACZ01901.1 ABC transporter related protein [Streptobacillus moniliformis DSM 12112]AVL43111.1 ABC transporter ATP-binding protein [Streptobacillus moniliformis]SQA12893.1 Glutathione import ATP-binding protein GsiA [Streptobacillus moniliformis]
MKDTLLKIENLSISFEQYGRGLKKFTTTPIENLNIEVKKGEILAIVGASGSGKSLLAHTVMDILPPNAIVNGKILYKDEILSKEKIKKYRGEKITFIPQSVNYLDPSMKVKDQIKIGLKNMKKEEKAKLQKEIFDKFELKENEIELYPYQLSGGMLRKVLFATSIKMNTELIIADEPTPGIHQSVLDKVLKQLRSFADSGISVILITHDIISAVKIADRITVFKDGRTIETVPSKFFSGEGENLKEEYSKKLWNALPQNKFLEVR